MAIGFARIEFVKRSSGKNACAKAAYNSRSRIEFEGNDLQDSDVYDWSSKEKPAYHEVLLPKWVDEKFKDPETLWNLVEQKEKRINSVTACELVLALPDDKGISLEDRIHLARTFMRHHFVDKGLVTQIDIHAPESMLIITRDNKDLGLKKGMTGQALSVSEDKIIAKLDTGTQITFNPKEFTGFIHKEHNWHAHVLVTTRLFKENGLELSDAKARDLIPRAAKGRVISGPDWGKLWAEHQNNYFQEKGIELRVDANGIVPQEHLGPYRMRARAYALLDSHHQRLELNQESSKNPENILEAITAQKSVFTKEDVSHFLTKHAPASSIDEVLKRFWEQPSLVQLADKSTGELIPKFTSQKVLEEEQQILRLSDRIYARLAFNINPKRIERYTKGLNPEQKQAFQGIIQGKKLSLIHGYAGTGKSHLLKALQTTYEESGYRIRAFGPDNATVDVLKEKGLNHTENVFRFLHALHHDRRKILNGKEVWILDEAGKLGNRPLLELLREAEKRDVQIILSGDSAQLPPVERGGMFRVFCEQYGSQVLEDIQRQKMEKHREIARSLATGEFGAALDKLSQAQGVRWAGNKREAMEELITRWAQDTRAFPQSSTLIIAHSNAEVKVLNEMVRLIRRQRGELGEREFQCATSQGIIYVSTGDRLEFRSNNKELGLTNGLSGTLIEAVADRFVVSIQSEDKRKQTVVFNPQEYHAFQLGYASTYYRSQGRTIDRGYVLHSPMMNKEMFYVGLTRHVRDVAYFVSKEEVYCLADLKRMALKSSSKDLTVGYTTLQELNSQREAQQRQKEIKDLKESESLGDRFKGYGLQTWDRIVGTVADVTERIQDRFPDRAFYHPTIPTEKKELYPVEELAKETLDQEVKEGSGIKLPGHEMRSLANLLDGASSQGSYEYLFDKFDGEQKLLAKSYSNAVEKASLLKQIVDAETEATSRDIRFAAHFKEWQTACGLRNQAAYELILKIPSQELGKKLDSTALSILQEQAGRYESFLAKREGAKQQIDDQLKEHLEPLLYRLFPEGPASRDRTSFRFGSKGSLSVVHSGAKAGQFYDFEQGEGGGLMKLIQRELGLGKIEAKAWAQDFLGVASDISIPRSFLRPAPDRHAEDVWVSLRPDANVPAPKLEELKGKKLAHYFTEVARHAYKDENGQLLYYVLRLEDKNEPGKKITPPLSYGYWKSQPEKIGWELKGFQSEKTPLYNLDLLKKNPHSAVLVVEGEKTADRARSNLPGGSYICMTWPGGAGAVQKANWAPLQGRKVLIWPDNDQAGYNAAERVCQELRKVGVESLQLVNKEDLKKSFPEKWDLADPLPTGVADHLTEKLLASALHKGIDPTQLILRHSLDPKDTLQKARINEILWRVDERLRPALEEKYGVQYWKVQEEILKETSQMISNQDKQKDELKQQVGVDGVVLERLTYQVAICEAQKGRKLRMGEIATIKSVIQDHGYASVSKIEDKEVTEFAIDKMLSITCEKTLLGVGDKDPPFNKTEAIATTVRQTQIQKMQEVEISISQTKDHGKETGNSFRI